jgi:Tol biopolymer transport system component
MNWRCLLAALGMSLYCATPPARAAFTERISVSSTGEEANGYSLLACAWAHSVTVDGRYVAFESYASNLVTGDDNGTRDVFVRDRVAGLTYCVSVTPTGAVGNGYSGNACISADGQCVAFESEADDLVTDDTNGVNDLFVHDLETGLTERVSVASDGTEANSHSSGHSISGDGRYVAFSSEATNLVAGDSNGRADVFVHDRQSGETELLSLASDGTQANGRSLRPAISSDGRYVAFESWGTNLVVGDDLGLADIFVHDRQTGETERVSVASGGGEADAWSHGPSISANGRWVAFWSYASNLVPGDVGLGSDVFVHDRETGQTERASVDSSGAGGNGTSWFASISADGRYVSYASVAPDLVAGDTNDDWDIFVCDRQTRQTDRVSLGPDRTEGNGYSDFPSISGNGRFVSFVSGAYNLVPNDTNWAFDVFLRDRQTFEDVPVGSWAFCDTEACVGAGIVAGYEDSCYHPEWAVARDQMAVYVSRALAGGDQSIPTGPAEPTFADVPTDHWAYNHVEYAHALGVVQGYWDGYHPEYGVDRGQMAVYIARAVAGGDLGVPDGPPTPTFPDVAPGGEWAWCYRHVEYIASEDVAGGYYDGLYHPEYPVTRDQMAVYIARAFGLV